MEIRKCKICDKEKLLKEFIYTDCRGEHVSPDRCNDCADKITRLSKMKYRAKQKKYCLVGEVTEKFFSEMLRFFTNEKGELICAYTGEVLEKYTIDHINALKDKGWHVIFNIVPCTKSANQSKGTKQLEEWYPQQKYYSKERLDKIYAWINYCNEVLIGDVFNDIFE